MFSPPKIKLNCIQINNNIRCTNLGHGKFLLIIYCVKSCLLFICQSMISCLKCKLSDSEIIPVFNGI